jgi:hypothetical protein
MRASSPARVLIDGFVLGTRQLVPRYRVARVTRGVEDGLVLLHRCVHEVSPMAKSKFFRVAVEGATTDGRTMERSWISDIAATYNPQTYGARIFLEHIRGLMPDGPFKAYGDVTAVKAEEITDGDLKGKLALFAQIEPTADLVSMTKAKQKIYSSIEVNPKFASTGRAYLVGLGVTDSPASLGTDMLTFAAQASANPLASRKQSPDNLFTAAEAIEIEWEEEPADNATTTLFAAIKERLAKLTGKAKVQDAQFAELGDALNGLTEALEQLATHSTATTQQFADQLSAFTRRLDTIEQAGKDSSIAFATLRAELEATPAFTPRPPATGGSGVLQTDC